MTASQALPPHRSFGHMLRDVNRAFQRALGTRISRFDVQLGQWYVLRVLWQEDGISQALIAQRAGIATPTTLMALRSLERAGHVRRNQNSEDRRRNVIHLTRTGRDLEEHCIAQAMAVNSAALAGIPEADVETALRVLRTAKANLLENPGGVDDGEA